MKTIIVATDFSETARHAADYAAQLALKLNCQLHLFHSYTIPFTNTDNPMPIIGIDELNDSANEGVNNEITRVQSAHVGLQVSGSVAPGDLVDCLSEMAEQYDVALIVTGTLGEEGDSFFWGSVAVKVLRQMNVPVLSVPLTAHWAPINKLCLSVDYKNIGEHYPYQHIINWASRLGSSVDVLYIAKPGNECDAPDHFANAMQAVQPRYHTVVSEELGDSVSAFVEDQKSDWLVVVPKKHGFFESLFRKSRTEALALSSNIPILALHERD